MRPAFANVAGNVGTGLSLACAVHCIVGPIVLTILPLSGLQLATAESLEWLIFPAFALVLAGIIVRSGTIHRRPAVLAAVAAAAALLIGSRFVDGVFEPIMSAAGTLTLGVTQLTCRWSAHQCECHAEANHDRR